MAGINEKAATEKNVNLIKELIQEQLMSFSVYDINNPEANIIEIQDSNYSGYLKFMYRGEVFFILPAWEIYEILVINQDLEIMHLPPGERAMAIWENFKEQIEDQASERE